MTPPRRDRIESMLRLRLDGYWWLELSDPPVAVAVMGDGPGRAATVATLSQLEVQPEVVELDDDPRSRDAWRTLAEGRAETLLAVVGPGWEPPPGWLDGLARHFWDGAVQAVVNDPALAPADSARIDWRVPGAVRRVEHLPGEGMIVRAAAVAAENPEGILRGIIDRGGIVVLDPARFDRGAPSERAPAPTSPTASGIAAHPRTPVSVVVPTVPSRAQAVERCLEAIAAQDMPREDIEVIVVPNGPGVAAMAPPRGADRVLPLVAPSAAAARSEGARAARGELVVFVDDDVLLEPGCVRAHAAAQSRRACITVGPYYPAPPSGSLAEQTAFRWWHAFLARMTRPGHRVTFADVLTGNLGVPPDLFLELGGLDPSFTKSRREDWEFGYRSLSAGVPVVIVPTARAVHDYATSAARLIGDAEGEGFGDAVLLERHPDLLEDLPLRPAAGAAASRSLSWRRDVALGRAAVGPLGPASRLVLATLERAGRRREWLWLLHRLSGAAYRAGVQRAIDAGHALPAPTHHETVLDLAGPIQPPPTPNLGQLVLTLAGRRLDAFHPHSGQWDVEEIIVRAANALEQMPTYALEPMLSAEGVGQ